MKQAPSLRGPGSARFGARAAMAARPRLSFGLLAAFVTLTMASAPAAVADEPDPCDKLSGFAGVSCDIGSVIPGAKALGNIWVSASETRKAISSVTSGNFLDDWAKGAAEAVTFLLAYIDSTAEKLTTPAYSQPWWLHQYAISFGLALIVLAFMMIVVTARIGSTDGSVSGVQLVRQAGWRFVFVVPAIAISPGFLYVLQQLAMELTKSFSSEAMKSGHGAVGEMMKKLKDSAGDWGSFGGVFLVILMMVFVILAAVILLVEIAVSQWGLMLAGLLVPFALVASVYPPWGRVLRGLASLIFTLMFLPVFVFFFFWTVWAAFQDMVGGDHAQNSGFSLLIFLLISFLMIDAFPLVALWLMKLVAPGGTSPMDSQVREIVPSASGGSPSSGSRRDKEVSEGVDDEEEYEGDEDDHGGSEDGEHHDSEGGGDVTNPEEGGMDSVDKSAPGDADDEGGEDVSVETADTHSDAVAADEGFEPDPGGEGEDGPDGSGSGPQADVISRAAPEAGSVQDAAGGGAVRGGPVGGAVEGGVALVRQEGGSAKSQAKETAQRNTSDGDDGGDSR
ncbi:hypothetical protein [Streptomyces sp. NPDC059708]|uniref:hypothetical protein n=1 Tax=Streptomyces sp. NPDC059708 TaxID=3346916 RepID=UPI0036CDAF31